MILDGAVVGLGLCVSARRLGAVGLGRVATRTEACARANFVLRRACSSSATSPPCAPRAMPLTDLPRGSDAQTARKTPAKMRTPGARSSAAALRDGQSLLATYRASRRRARAAATPVGDAQASTRLFADPRTPPGAAETRELEHLCALAQSISRRLRVVVGQTPQSSATPRPRARVISPRSAESAAPSAARAAADADPAAPPPTPSPAAVPPTPSPSNSAGGAAEDAFADAARPAPARPARSEPELAAALRDMSAGLVRAATVRDATVASLEAENERLRRRCGDLERRPRERASSCDGVLRCVDRDPIFHAREVDGAEDGAPAPPRSSAGPAFVPAAAPFQAREVEDEVASPLSDDSRRVAARLAEERALRAREVEDEAAAPIFRAREVEDEVAASSDDDATVSPKDVDRLLGRERPEETTRWAAVPETYLRPGISISPLPV